MSTLRITNIEAKADPSSPTVDEKIKLTNSNGDILVHIDGKTSGITTIGINTTAGNIKFDQNSNVVVTGIITATKFVGTIEPTTLTVGGDLTIPDKIIHTGDTNTSIRFPAADTFTVETSGSEALRVDSSQRLLMGVDSTSFTTRALFQGSSSGTGGSIFIARNQATPSDGAALGTIFFGASNHSQASRIASARDGGTWTAGSSQPSRIEFATTADGASSPTERLRIKSDGDVYIGNIAHSNEGGANSSYRTLTLTDTTNGAQLHLRGQSPKLFLDVTGGGNGEIYYDTGDLRILSGEPGGTSSEKLRIDSSGRLMVGTTTEGFATYGDKLTIADSGHCGMTIRSGTSSYGTIYFSDGDDGSADEVRGFIDYNHSNNQLQLGTDGATRLRITDAGMVGINMTPSTTGSSTYMLQMYNAGSQCFMSIGQGSGNGPLNGLVIGVSNAAHYVTGRENRPMIFGTNDTERMRIGNDGKFYYATTSQGPHGGFFNINASNSGRNGINVQGTSANYVMVSSAGGSTGDHIYFSNYSNNNQETGRIKDNSSNVTYYTSSDYRLKDNIVSITDGITRVKQLNPVRHTWINNPALGTVDGWIAHELDEVCPDAVDGEKDAVREDGSIKAQAADYGRITPLLAAALKELIAKVETLEAAVTALQGS